MPSQLMPDSVKRAGEVQEISKEQAAEWLKCKKNPIYFITKYILITHVDKGLVPFNLYKYQKQMIKNYFKHRFNINLLSRQAGKTSAVAAFAIHHVLFDDRKMF